MIGVRRSFELSIEWKSGLIWKALEVSSTSNLSCLFQFSV